MNLKLKDQRHVPPPGYFRHIQKESGLEIRAGSFGSLLYSVRQHRLANDYPIGLLFERELEQQECEFLMSLGHVDWVVRLENPEVPLPSQNLTGDQMLRGALTMFHRLLTSEYESQEEANRRAAICAVCNLNGTLQGCTGCGGARKLRAFVENTIGRRKTPQDEDLGVCAICGCSLRVKVWYPLTSLHKFEGPEIQEQLPAHCWVKKQKT